MLEQLGDNTGLSYNEEKERFESSFNYVLGTAWNRTYRLLPSFVVDRKSGNLFLHSDVVDKKPRSILDIGISHMGGNTLRLRPFPRILRAESIAGVYMEQHSTDTSDGQWIYKVTRFEEHSVHGLKEYIAHFHTADVADFYPFRTLLDSLYRVRTDTTDPHFNPIDFLKLSELDVNLLSPIIPDLRMVNFDPREFK